MVPDCHGIQFGVDRCPSLPLGENGGRTTLQAGDGRKGLSSTSAPDSPDDEGYDILWKPSASSLHQIRHIHDLRTRRFVAEVEVRDQPS
jgi:hypothetical protein